MDYDVFMKSKRIAERWGEAQAALGKLPASDQLRDYQHILKEFYDYIQFLEARLFVQSAQEKTETGFSDLSLQASHLANALPSLSAQEDEEDPWFGFQK